jgi:hypothetical protein
MMDPDNPERKPGNIVEMQWILQRELGGNLVYQKCARGLPTLGGRCMARAPHGGIAHPFWAAHIRTSV